MKRHEIDELIGTCDVLLKDRQVLVDRLKNAIDRYKTHPQNRNGRGIKQCVRERICQTVHRLGYVLGVSRQHSDSQIRHKAKKLLRSIPHHREFFTLERQTKELVSKSIAFSRRHRLRTNSRVIKVTNTLQLEEVSSASMLQRVGTHLGVCVRHPSEAQDHFDEVLYGKMELWAILRAQEIVGLMRVENEYKRKDDYGVIDGAPANPNDYSRQVVECKSFKNENLRLSRGVALKIVKFLQIDQVHARTFSQVGAFPMFLCEDILHPMPEPVFDGVQWHYVWRTTYHIVIASTKKKPVEHNGFKYSIMKWSYFQSEPNNDWADDWYTNSFLSKGDLLKLILNFPSMYRLTNEIRGSRKDLRLSSEWI